MQLYPTARLSAANVHRVSAVLLLLAAKISNDRYVTNVGRCPLFPVALFLFTHPSADRQPSYARIAGIQLQELNRLERVCASPISLELL